MKARSWTGEVVPVGSPGAPRRRARAGLRAAAAFAAVAAGVAMLAGAPGAAGAAGAAKAAGHAANAPRPAGPRVLLVGTWHGIKGQYTTVQAAVNAAQAGDWVLVAPGDYHESPASEVGVWLWSAVHLRGMDRNGVIIDGTRPGAPVPCDSAPQWQNFGPATPQLGYPTWSRPRSGAMAGRNGIYDSKQSGATVENLTVCNFLSGSGPETGNQVWFDGGHFDRPTIHSELGAFGISYVTTYNTWTPAATAASYGVFVSNSTGPGTIDHDYASGFNDAGFYIGGCPNCGTTMDQDVAEGNVLGYSGTNSGGNLVIKRSIFAFDKSGIAPNSENNNDGVPPQSGACPSGVAGPLNDGICMVIEDNYVFDDNNPNVPGGTASGTSSEVGTGILLGGSQHVATFRNRVVGNGSWGILVTDRPDIETPPPPSNCQGGTSLTSTICYFPAYGDLVGDNALTGNGFFAQPTNGDLAEGTLPHNPGNCWFGNVGTRGSAPTSDPADLDATQSRCFAATTGDLDGKLGVEEACNIQIFGACTPKSEPGIVGDIALLVGSLGYSTAPLKAPGMSTLPADYPQQVAARAPAPGPQQSMANPCAGVPADPWCPATTSVPPSAPTVAQVQQLGGAAIVDWKPPASAGTGRLTSYTVSAWPGGATVTVPAGPRNFARITGIGTDAPAFFTVTATNSAGLSTTSPPSAIVLMQPGNVFATAAGTVEARNSAVSFGHPSPPRAPIVGIAHGPDGTGYFLAGSDGSVYAFGAARQRGSLVGVALAAPITGIAANPGGTGYWMVGRDGGVFAFGRVHGYGSLPGLGVHVDDIVGITPTPDGGGYWLVGADGGVFAFGDARFRGSATPYHLGSPAVAIAASPTGAGYWVLSRSGGVYTFGLVGFYGSASGEVPAGAVSIAASPDGTGYWVLGADGTVKCFGTASRYGPGVLPPPAPGDAYVAMEQPPLS
jgi:hypothetical protein